jgi:hypothetical protein
MLLTEVGQKETVEQGQQILVNGKEVSQAQLQEMQTDKNIRLKKLEEGSFKVLQKLEG